VAYVVRIVNMHEAKTHLSRLVDEEFIIARDGRPVGESFLFVMNLGHRGSEDRLHARNHRSRRL